MPLPPLRPDGTLPPGQHQIADTNDLFVVYPATTPTRRALNDALAHCAQIMRQFTLGIVLLIDGSYLTGKAEPNDVDMALLSTGASETAILQRLQDEGVDLNLLDIFVVLSQQDLDGWRDFFSVDGSGQPRGIVLLTI
jgi:hypothetical protein